MRRLRSAAASLATLIITVPPISGYFPAQAQAIPSLAADAAAAAMQEYLLEVFINGASTQLIASFKRDASGSFAIDPDQLRNVGIFPAPEAMRPDGLIDIALLPGVGFEYRDEDQTIHFTAEADTLAARTIDALDDDGDVFAGDETGSIETVKDKAQQAGTGAVVNYTLYGSSGGEAWGDIGEFQGISGSFETRVFSPFGILSSTQILGLTPDDPYGSTRLETNWSYSDDKRLLTYRIGDVTTGGLGWTRPVRLGGLQLQRNFSLRPDLVTMPLPALSGSAAVPSTVDVYINDSRRFSQDLPAGPFSITNVPIITGSGTARLVVTDALGRETISETPFYASPDLLATGLWDVSAEAGFARRAYGVESDDYDDRLMLSGTMRAGVLNWLTLEGHGEGGGGLFNGGIGAAFTAGRYGAGTFALAASRYGDETGLQLSASIEAEIFDAHLFARTQRTFSGYNDIASVTSVAVGELSAFNAKVPRAIDQLTVTLPSFDAATINLSLTQLESGDGDRSRLASVTANRAIGDNGNAFLTAYADIERSDSFGLYAGLSWRFGNGVSASAGLASDHGGASLTTEVSRSAPTGDKKPSWRVRNTAGSSESRAASVRQPTGYGQLEATVQQYGDSVQGNAQVDGAIVMAGGGVFLTNRVDDAFGVVDVGAPDVDVELENKHVGRTNRQGKLLVPGLRSHEANAITIDPSNLPIGAEVEETRRVVKPGDRSGVVVRINVKAETKPALVTLRDEAGQFIEAGATGKIGGSADEIIIGYDGQVYVTDFGTHTTLTVTRLSGAVCTVPLVVETSSDGIAQIDAICRSAS